MAKSVTKSLLVAAEEGDLILIKSLLKTPGICVSGINKHGESPLHISAGNGRLDIAKVLLENLASVNLKDKQGDTPLYLAARHGHVGVVEFLCKNGATVNTQNTAGETALNVSARYGHVDVLSYLCQAGAQLDIKDNEGDTPLHCGCWHGYQRVAECLVKSGCSLSAINSDAESALHIAAVRGYYGIARILCKNGCELNQPDKEGRSAIHLSVLRNHLNIVQLLCEQRCNVDLQDNNGDTALHSTAREGQLSIFHALHSAKCDLDISNQNGATPLHLAAKYGHTELAKLLCLAGCDMNAVTQHGFSADEVAANHNHHELASVLHHLKKHGVQDHYITELRTGKSPVTRAKLLVCGAAGVGKTELIDSLKHKHFQSLFRRRAVSDLSHMTYKRTCGMTVQQMSIPNVGDYSVWDFSGQKDFYITHEYFLGARNSLFLVVFSLRDPLLKQIAQVRFWLAMLKAKQASCKVIHFAGCRVRKPHVLLIGSFADQQQISLMCGTDTSNTEDIFSTPLETSDISQLSAERPLSSNSATVLQTMVQDFREHFLFEDRVYELDCRTCQAKEFRLLKERLKTLRQKVLGEQKHGPPLVKAILDILPSWRKEYSSLPAVSWKLFYQKIRDLVNPLVTEDSLRLVTAILHDTGEMVYFDNDAQLRNVVVLNPTWLGTQVFGPILFPANLASPQLKSDTGLVSLSDLQTVFFQWDASSVVNLLEHFQLCTPLNASRQQFLFPSLIKMESHLGLWEKDVDHSVYAGVHVECKSKSDVFTPGLFPLLQVSLCKAFTDAVDGQELVVWSDGLKYCKSCVQVHLTVKEPHKNIQLLVRGTEESRKECYVLFQYVYATVVKNIRYLCHGTDISTHVLSVEQLRNHIKSPYSYPSSDIHQAKRDSCSLSHPTIPGLHETVLDLVWCGWSDTLESDNFTAPCPTLSDLPVQARTELSKLLDPPENLGRDWCLLAVQLGVADKIPLIHQANDGASPTDKLLSACSEVTLVTIVDALGAIGRDDVVKVLLDGLSPFANLEF